MSTEKSHDQKGSTDNLLRPSGVDAEGKPRTEFGSAANTPRGDGSEAALVFDDTRNYPAPLGRSPLAIPPIYTKVKGNAPFKDREAERCAELKYRQLKEHTSHLKALVHAANNPAAKDSSAYLEALELLEAIPQLRHLATRYFHADVDELAQLEGEVAAWLESVPWLGKLAHQDPMGIRLIGDPPRDRRKRRGNDKEAT